MCYFKIQMATNTAVVPSSRLWMCIWHVPSGIGTVLLLGPVFQEGSGRSCTQLLSHLCPENKTVRIWKLSGQRMLLGLSRVRHMLKKLCRLKLRIYVPVSLWNLFRAQECFFPQPLMLPYSSQFGVCCSMTTAVSESRSELPHMNSASFFFFPGGIHVITTKI